MPPLAQSAVDRLVNEAVSDFYNHVLQGGNPGVSAVGLARALGQAFDFAPYAQVVSSLWHYGGTTPLSPQQLAATIAIELSHDCEQKLKGLWQELTAASLAAGAYAMANVGSTMARLRAAARAVQLPLANCIIQVGQGRQWSLGVPRLRRW